MINIKPSTAFLILFSFLVFGGTSFLQKSIKACDFSSWEERAIELLEYDSFLENDINQTPQKAPEINVIGNRVCKLLYQIN